MVLPLFFLLLFGSIGWGYSLTIYDSMFDAARQAARELAVGRSTEVAAAASAATLLDNWPNAFLITAEDVATTGTNDVRVVVSTPNAFATIFPFISLPEDLSAEVIMRKE